MTEAVPNLWPKKFSRGILTPLAVLRVQAAKFKEMTEGLLEAEVTTEKVPNGTGLPKKRHRLEAVAPALDDYRRSILVAEHDDPGAYPVFLTSDFLDLPAPPDDPESKTAPTPPDWWQVRCGSQEQLFERLAEVFGSETLTTLVESLIAQINDAEMTPTSA